jgi:hypothetical protein
VGRGAEVQSRGGSDMSGLGYGNSHVQHDISEARVEMVQEHPQARQALFFFQICG